MTMSRSDVPPFATVSCRQPLVEKHDDLRLLQHLLEHQLGDVRLEAETVAQSLTCAIPPVLLDVCSRTRSKNSRE